MALLTRVIFIVRVVFRQSAGGTMQDDHRDAERRDEDSSIDARKGAVCREERERGAREGCREKELAGQIDPKRDENRAQSSDAKGDERRAAEKRAGSRPWKSREVRRQTSRDVLDLQPRDEEGEKEGRDTYAPRGPEETSEEGLGAQDDQPKASSQKCD
jgi:hypothetical protein